MRLHRWFPCCRPTDDSGGGARAVAETVQFYITAMDSLKLNMVAVDQVGWVGVALYCMLQVNV
jgi:hypothetical protein